MSRLRHTARLLRAIWRYRGRIEEHGREYQVELATTVHAALHARLAGRLLLVMYRWGMRLLVGVVLACCVLAALVGWAAWNVGWGASLVAVIVLLAPAAAAAWWWLKWGAALRWLDEHADHEREVSMRELPARLRALSAETAQMLDVPARLGEELEELAKEAESTSYTRARDVQAADS